MMDRVFQSIGFLIGSVAGPKAEIWATSIIKFVIAALPADAEALNEQWLSDHTDIECPKLKMGNALSLAWRMRHCVTAKLITKGEPEKQQRPAHHRWRLDAIQMESYGLQPSRVISELPESLVALRVGENIYVMSALNESKAFWVLKEGFNEGMAMRTCKDGQVFSARVSFTEDVAMAICEAATEPSKEWFQDLGKTFRAS